jgi:hypothetical protein
MECQVERYLLDEGVVQVVIVELAQMINATPTFYVLSVVGTDGNGHQQACDD